jgi:hypothetical protein
MPDSANTATIRTAPGFSRFTVFSSNLADLEGEVLTYDATLVSDDKQDTTATAQALPEHSN